MANFGSKTWVLYLILGGIAVALYTSDTNWQASAEVLRDGLILTWMVSIMNILFFSNGLSRLFGIRPRQPIGLLGIAFSPLLHRDLGHLFANTVPFLVLGWLIVLQGEIQGESDFYAITATVALIGGMGTWLFGRNAVHVGASGIIFGYIGYLLSGVYVGPTLITLVFAGGVFWLYGSQLWSMVPSSDGQRISWEGHLFGFIGGIVAGTRPDFLSALGSSINQLIGQ